MTRQSFQLSTLEALYGNDPAAPERVIRQAFERATEAPKEVFIHRAPLERLLADLESARERRARGERLPLFGVPCAVKDNIDVAGMPTTAACAALEYRAERSAFAVERLTNAGAIVIGKTNLDQLATGLVGVRSPYGVCKNPFDPRYITGGSSSGSALAVALGVVSFALGTDTAGSGRVPAALCNIVGLKPTRGVISTTGVVPACRSLDCVSVFAASCSDSLRVLDVCEGFDPHDPYARRAEARKLRPGVLRLGVPRPAELEFYGDVAARKLYEASLARFAALGVELVEIDFEPFRETAALLYGGPWVAERLRAGGALLREHPEALLPVLRGILEGARSLSALDAFEGEYRLHALRKRAAEQWERMDVLVLPTTPTTYSIDEILEEPIVRNSRLGVYTNFTNLLDLAAVAVPAGFRPDGLPLGVTLFGPAHTERDLARVAAGFLRGASVTLGATGEAVVETIETSSDSFAETLLAVAGAHLSGEPLNHQLTSRGARLVRACKTSHHYRMYALAGTVPPKPGLVRDPRFEGGGIDVEVWALDAAAFGSFVDEVPAPLAIGTVVLEDGTTVNGFVCEPYSLDGAVEITAYKGWRQYLASKVAGSSASRQ